MKVETEDYKRYKKYIRSKEWQTIRDTIFEERGHKCQCCGRIEGEDKCKLSVHHNSYNNLYDELNHKEDLLVVCSVCHKSIHMNRNNFKRFKMN